jgi:hypothetical protein
LWSPADPRAPTLAVVDGFPAKEEAANRSTIRSAMTTEKMGH